MKNQQVEPAGFLRYVIVFSAIKESAKVLPSARRQHNP
jgi:hypothetical protein